MSEVLEELRVPPELSARAPVEDRGDGGRDAVRLLAGRREGGAVSHHVFGELPGLLRAGDVLVVNTSQTLPAAVDGRLGEHPVVVHFSTRQDDGRWAVELRTPDARGTTLPRAGGPAGGPPPGFAGGGTPGEARGSTPTGEARGSVVVALPGAERLTLLAPLSPRGDRLWLAAVSMGDPVAYLHRYGRAIRYGYTDRDQPLAAYQTVFSVPSADGLGSAEMPSAARPFTAGLVTELVSRGVQIAPIVLHTGVASAEAHEPPYAERFAVPASTAWLVNAARAGGGRVVAVGTTAVRALESAADGRGLVRGAQGWTELVITPERGVRVVDGLLTGLHDPEASHLLMLEAVAGRGLLERVYGAAVAGRYLWHEFGDVNLLLP